MPRAGWSSRLAAAIRNASGSHPHIRASSAAAVASAATRSGPTMRASSSPASAGESASRVRGRAPSRATSPRSRSRLETSTRQPGLAGNKGRTWSAWRALSSTTSNRLSASNVRYMAAASASSAGTSSAATPKACGNWASASIGRKGGVGA